MTATQTMSIAITGGSGRVGRILRSVLSPRSKSMRVLDIVEPADLGPNETFRHVDMSDLEAVTRAFEGIDGVVHLAGLPNERSLAETLHVNVLGASNLYEAARLTGVTRVVLGSSNHAVGFYPKTTRIAPDSPMRPDTLYGLSKCWAELMGGLYYDKHAIRTLAIRIGNALPDPATPRTLDIWISPRDLAQLTAIGLTHPDIDCVTVFGVGKDGGSFYDNSSATRLGYDPQDRALDFAGPDPFRPHPMQKPEVSDFFQGGIFTEWGHEGDVRVRK